MKHEWDKKKNEINVQKHGFDFADAHEIFEGPMFVLPDQRKDYGEDRWVGIGSLKGQVVVITYTEHEDIIRVISLRKALKHERKIYEKEIEKIIRD